MRELFDRRPPVTSTETDSERRVNPDLTTVICTYNRPELLRRALDAVRNQTYPGTIETIVVFDKSDPDTTLDCRTGNRPVRTMRNARTSGLPGARNTGILAASAPVIAVCDDDDEWAPEKATRQLAVLDAEPATDVVFSGIRAITDTKAVVRIPESDRLTFPMLLASRVAHAHISTAMFRREAILERIGLFDEEIPGGYSEDYEFTLRAAQRVPIAIVREPLVDVRWGTASHFKDRWHTIDEALAYLLDEFPEFATVPRGRARIEGQRAFALAAAGDRTAAWSVIRDVLRDDWRQPRAYLAALVATHVVSAPRLLAMVNRTGHGI
jgi:glycosyltransferase involved in cell wall biosynthesis